VDTIHGALVDAEAKHDLGQYAESVLNSAATWVEAEEELAEFQELMQGDLAIEESQLIDLSDASGRISLLFDLAAEELEEPGASGRYVEKIETSAERRIDNYQLSQQFEKLDQLVKEQNLSWDKPQIVEAPAEDYSLEFMLQPAPLWRRCGANMVDVALAVILSLVVGYLGGFSQDAVQFFESSISGVLPQSSGLLLLGSELLLIAYLCWSILTVGMLATFSKTCGRSIFKIELADTQGFPPSFSQCLLRTLLSPLNVMTCGLSLLPTLFGARRSLADLGAGTTLIKQPNSQ
jgi:uncharacterized RDD family membrane protein YckC